MYKLLIVSYYSPTAAAASVASVVVEFRTRELADTAADNVSETHQNYMEFHKVIKLYTNLNTAE